MSFLLDKMKILNMRKMKYSVFLLVFLMVSGVASAGSTQINSEVGVLGTNYTGDLAVLTSKPFINQLQIRDNNEANIDIASVEARVGDIGDWDGDGGLEAFYVDRNEGSLNYYDLETGNTTQVLSKNVEDVGAMADVDSDGLMEITYLNSKYGSLVGYDKNGNYNSLQDPAYRPVDDFADWDNDGSLEWVNIQGNNLGDFRVNQIGAETVYEPHQFVGFADWDRDNELEAFFITKDSNSEYYLEVYDRDSGAKIISYGADSLDSIPPADWDGDGLIEVGYRNRNNAGNNEGEVIDAKGEKTTLNWVSGTTIGAVTDIDGFTRTVQNVSEINRSSSESYSLKNNQVFSNDLVSQSYLNVSTVSYDISSNFSGRVVDQKCGFNKVRKASSISSGQSVTCDSNVKINDFVSSSDVFDRNGSGSDVESLSSQDFKSFYDLDFSNSAPIQLNNVNISGNLKKMIDLPTGSGTVYDYRYVNHSGDYISGVQELSDFTVASGAYNFSSQVFNKESDLILDSSAPVKLRNVNISGKCLDNSRINMSKSTSDQRFRCTSSKVEKDKLTVESETGISFISGKAVFGSGLANRSIADKKFTVSNSFGSTIPVNVSEEMVLPNRCVYDLDSRVSFVSGNSSKTVDLSCKVGKEINYSLSKSSISNGVEYNYSADFKLYQDPPLGDRQYCIPEQRLNNISSAQSDSIKVQVDGESLGFDYSSRVFSGNDYFCVNLPESKIGASPHSTTVTYEIQDGSSSGSSSSSFRIKDDGFQGTAFGTGNNNQVSIENNKYKWRTNIFDKPTVDTLSVIRSAGSDGSFVISVVNLDDKPLEYSLKVVGNNSVVKTVDLARKHITVGSGKGNRKAVKVDYKIPESWSFKQDYEFGIRVTDPSWDGFSNVKGVEYVGFQAERSGLGILSRFGRLFGSVEISGNSIPFFVLPLIPSVLMFVVLSALGGVERKSIAVSSAFSLVVFLILTFLIPSV